MLIKTRRVNRIRCDLFFNGLASPGIEILPVLEELQFSKCKSAIVCVHASVGVHASVILRYCLQDSAVFVMLPPLVFKQ